MGNRQLKLTAAGAVLCLMLGGCARSTINYQVAEAIGTVGQYENNEPVETPKMQLEREQRELEESEAEAFAAQLAYAQELAEGYWYQEAIDYLNGLDSSDEEVQALLTQIEEAQDSLVTWSGSVPHLCFPTLIEDSLRAFDGDAYSDTYASTMITTSEFKAILESLYENDYILIDLHSVAALETDNRGVTTMETQDLQLPSGKKPIILSQDNVDYSGIQNGDGIATRLVLGDNNEVVAEYTDNGGHLLQGSYDFVPILNDFIEEHPDFSYRGAGGIVSVSGSNGVFGYDIGEGSDLTDTQTANRETVAAICSVLKEQGWSVASAGYTHSYMNSMQLSEITEEISSWSENVGTLTGGSDILFYPYGAEVTYPSDQLDVLLDAGFAYLCGLWSDTDFMELGDDYLRQTRRFIDGYTLVNAPGNFSDFFDAYSILSDDR